MAKETKELVVVDNAPGAINYADPVIINTLKETVA